MPKYSRYRRLKNLPQYSTLTESTISMTPMDVVSSSLKQKVWTGSTSDRITQLDAIIRGNHHKIVPTDDDDTMLEEDDDEDSESLLLGAKRKTVPIQLEKASYLSKRLPSFSSAINELKEKFKSLMHIGSKSYTIEEKKLAIKSIISAVVISYDVRDEEERSPEDAYQDPPSKPLSLYQATEIVAKNLHICRKSLGVWLKEFLETGDIAEVLRKSTKTIITSGRSVSLEAALELLWFHKDKISAGYTVDYGVLQRHLNQENRCHSFINLDNCPVQLFSKAAIREAMVTIGGLEWGDIKRIGKQRKKFEQPEESVERRLWRDRVYVVEYAIAKQLERSGKAVIASSDESYCGTNYLSGQSLLPLDVKGKPIADVGAAVGPGERVCFVDSWTRYGPISETGSKVRLP